MNDRALLLRMAVVSTILFGFYLALVQVALWLGLGWAPIVVGLVLFVTVQYVIGTRGVLHQIAAADIPEEDFAAFVEEYERTAESMGFEEPPRLMVAWLGVPNALAVGRKGNGTVILSAELIYLLDFDEAAAVAAHELAHLKNRDSIFMVIGESLSTLIGLAVILVIGISDNPLVNLFALVLGMISKLFTMLFVLALSRYREYAADRDAAAAMGSGDPLARALRKIEVSTDPSRAAVPENVNALCFSPISKGLLTGLLSTHPPTERRIERLQLL